MIDSKSRISSHPHLNLSVKRPTIKRNLGKLVCLQLSEKNRIEAELNKELEEDVASKAANFLLDLPTPEVLKDFNPMENLVNKKDQKQPIPAASSSGSTMHLQIPSINQIPASDSLSTPEVHRSSEGFLTPFHAYHGQETPQSSGPLFNEPNFPTIHHTPQSNRNVPTEQASVATHETMSVEEFESLMQSQTHQMKEEETQDQIEQMTQPLQYHPAAQQTPSYHCYQQNPMVNPNVMLPTPVAEMHSNTLQPTQHRNPADLFNAPPFLAEDSQPPYEASYDSGSESGDQTSSGEGGSTGAGSKRRRTSEDSGAGGKKSRPTKKQQFDDLKTREKELTEENADLKTRVMRYEIACKKLKQVLMERMRGSVS